MQKFKEVFLLACIAHVYSWIVYTMPYTVRHGNEDAESLQ